MIYYAKKKKTQKKGPNFQKKGKNYSISLLISKGNIEISLNYKKDGSKDELKYWNCYTYSQFQVINKYFRKFLNLEHIYEDLENLLKNNNEQIEEKNDFIILSIPAIYEDEPTNIIFKLLKNKKSNFVYMINEESPSSFKNDGQSKGPLSMPRYANNDKKHKKRMSNINLEIDTSSKKNKISYYKSSHNNENVLVFAQKEKNNLEGLNEEENSKNLEIEKNSNDKVNKHSSHKKSKFLKLKNDNQHNSNEEKLVLNVNNEKNDKNNIINEIKDKKKEPLNKKIKKEYDSNAIANEEENNKSYKKRKSDDYNNSEKKEKKNLKINVNLN